jgi:structural maintenance of chromosome 2
MDAEIEKKGKSANMLTVKQRNAAKKVAELQVQIEHLGFSFSEFHDLELEKNNLEHSISQLEQATDRLSTQLEARLSFRYIDPTKGFDRSKVKGLVAKLMDVKDSLHATALEVVAGGKLLQVVVDEAITGKALLDRGKLQRRVTIIPLDKIRPKLVSNASCKEADTIAAQANATVNTAIDLIAYDEEVRAAMEYVFGCTFVVDDLYTANSICDKTKVRAVTVDGDVYDPSGTISGGSKNELGKTLSDLSTLKELKQQLHGKKQTLEAIVATFGEKSSAAAAQENLAAKLAVAHAELENVEKQISQTTFGILIEQRAALAKDLSESENECSSMEKEKRIKWQLFERLKAQETTLTQEREARLQSLENELLEAKQFATAKTMMAREVRVFLRLYFSILVFA